MRSTAFLMCVALPLSVWGTTVSDTASVEPQQVQPTGAAPVEEVAKAEPAGAEPAVVEPAAAAPAPAVVLPAAPALSGRALSASKAELVWSDCQLANQRDAGFTLQLKALAEREWRVARSVGPDLLMVSVEGLAPETQYEFRVWASNAAGTTCSNVFTLTTPVDEAVATAIDALRARNIYASGVGQSSSLLLMPAPDVVAQVTTLSTRAQLLSGNSVVVPGLVSSPAGLHSFVLQMGGAPLAATEATGGMGAGVDFEVVDRLAASAGMEATPAVYSANLEGVASGDGISAVESYRPVLFVPRAGWRVACRAQLGGDNAVYVPLIVVSPEPKSLRMRVVGELPPHAELLPQVIRQEPEIEVLSGEVRVAFAPELPVPVAAPVTPEIAPEAGAGQPAPAPEVAAVPAAPVAVAPVHEVELMPVLAKGVYTVRITGKVAKAGPVSIEIWAQE
ncbi:MAG TPA: fibronectin type III domain-containing protein [Opitutaceae bacterium]|nr:fibronectin type III domain-containing protein [Opitutaceae bacterium]